MESQRDQVTAKTTGDIELEKKPPITRSRFVMVVLFIWYVKHSLKYFSYP